MISVVLADDHVVVRTGIKMLLDADPDIEVVAEAAEGTEAYSLVARYKPDVLLLDISMPPGQSGLIACEKTAKDFPDTKVVILTMFAEPEYLLYTLRGGAAGYMLKNSTPEQLRQARARRCQRRQLYPPRPWSSYWRNTRRAAQTTHPSNNCPAVNWRSYS